MAHEIIEGFTRLVAVAGKVSKGGGMRLRAAKFLLPTYIYVYEREREREREREIRPF